MFDIVPDTIEFSMENELEELVKNSNKIDFEFIAEQNIKCCNMEPEKMYKDAFEYI